MKHILPEGWRIKGGFLECPKENYSKHVLFSDGKLDRETIAIVLENWGHEDIAKRWNLTTVEAAAPDMLQALKSIVEWWECNTVSDTQKLMLMATAARAAIEKSKGF